MAKVVIAGEAVVITSALKLEDIRALERYRPDALTLKGGKDGTEDIFKIGTSDSRGRISRYGISFDNASHDDGKFATLTVCLECPEGTEDVQAWVAETYGTAIINLNKLEETLPDVISGISAERAEVLHNISIAQ